MHRPQRTACRLDNRQSGYVPSSHLPSSTQPTHNPLPSCFALAPTFPSSLQHHERSPASSSAVPTYLTPSLAADGQGDAERSREAHAFDRLNDGTEPPRPTPQDTLVLEEHYKRYWIPVCFVSPLAAALALLRISLLTRASLRRIPDLTMRQSTPSTQRCSQLSPQFEHLHFPGWDSSVQRQETSKKQERFIFYQSSRECNYADHRPLCPSVSFHGFCRSLLSSLLPSTVFLASRDT